MGDFSIRDPKVSVFENIRSPKNASDSTFANICKRIETDKGLKETQTLYRKTKDNNVKNLLPAVTFAGVFTQRNNESFKAASGLMVLDFDKFPDPETLQAFRLKLISDPIVRAAFISPSGSGIKAVINIPKVKNDADYKKYFVAAEKRYNSPYFDVKTSAISQPCYLAYDPEIYVNNDAEVFQPDQTFETEEAENFERLLVWMQNKGSHFMEGNRNNYVNILAGACCRFGIEKNEALDLILNEVYVSNDFPISEVKSAVNSAYKRNQFASESFDQDFEIKMRKAADAEALEQRQVNKNEFPTSVFPAFLKDFIDQHYTAFGFQPDFVGGAILFAGSVALGLSREVKLKNGFIQSAAINILLVGKSGTAKSPAAMAVLKTIYKKDSESYKAFIDENDVWDVYNLLTKKEKDELFPEPPAKPILKRHIISDATQEAKLEYLYNNSNGGGVFSDEFIGNLNSKNQYKKRGVMKSK